MTVVRAHGANRMTRPLVVTAGGVSRESPGVESIGRFVSRGVEDGACAVDEEGTEKDVALLGDGAEPAARACGCSLGVRPR